MFSRLAPLQAFFAALMVLCLAVVGAGWLASQQPWLGVAFSSAGADGVRVAAVDPNGPAAGLLKPGDRVVAAGPARDLVPLAHYDPGVIPHAYPTYAEYEAYLDFQAPMARALAGEALTLVLESGERVALQPRATQPWYALGADFWLLHLFGATAAMIGLFVWVFRPRLVSAKLLAISGVGFFLATWHNSIWTVREIALRPGLFDVLLRGNNLALHLMLGALMALLACYPRTLLRGWWAITAVVLAVGLIQLNENLRWLDWPQHSFYFPLLVYYLVGAGLAFLQWRRSSGDPLDRGALRWVVLSVLLSMGAGLVVYFLPLFFANQALVSTTAMVGLAVMLYLGFALGVLRYRLFDLERWWFDAWVWFFGGVAVVGADAALVLLLGMEPVHALGLAVIVTGWLYFPVRQGLWRRFVGVSPRSVTRDLAEFVQRVFSAQSPETVEQAWRDTLNTRLEPLALEPVPVTHPVPAVALRENGARLDVPGITDAAGGYVLRFGQRGRRLFSRQDVELVNTLQGVGERLFSIRSAQEAGARTERQRIMRDLHDDVGGQLLTLILTAEDTRRADLARSALQALREAVNALDDDQRRRLEDFLDDWCASTEARLLPAEARLSLEGDWDNPVDYELNARQAINLRRVLDEAVTNALKHAAPEWLLARMHIEGGELHMAVEHNGVPPASMESAQAEPGRGQVNMRTRIQELGGTLEIGAADDDVYRVAFTVPLA